MTRADPRRPSKPPNIKCATNLEDKNNNNDLLFSSFFCSAKIPASSPPCTAKQDKPPVVSPATNANNI